MCSELTRSCYVKPCPAASKTWECITTQFLPAAYKCVQSPVKFGLLYGRYCSGAFP